MMRLRKPREVTVKGPVVVKLDPSTDARLASVVQELARIDRRINSLVDGLSLIEEAIRVAGVDPAVVAAIRQQVAALSAADKELQAATKTGDGPSEE